MIGTNPTNPTIKQVSVDNVSWTPIRATVTCNYWWLRCVTSDCKFRSDPNDVTTEDTFIAFSQFPVLTQPVLKQGQDPVTRYNQNDTLGYVQSVQPTATVVLTQVV